MSDPSQPFTHGAFWDRYSQNWDEEIRPHIEGTVLGEEWTAPARTRFIFERFAEPYLSTSARVVEIGPGGGKFSREIVGRCRELVLVDISREMLRRANRACDGRAREVLIEDGNFQDLDPGSIDLVFSYDVFIHLESEEVFRYFAEVNKILRTGGVFSVHTSSYESRWGFHSYLQQIRGHQQDIGTRYGGRMYPMSESILRRFAEHSGFVVVDAYSNREDRDVILALRKARPAHPWTFATTPELYRRFELSERVGGSDRRELYAALSPETGEPLILAVGDVDDPRLRATARVSAPEHPSLAAARGWEEHAGIGIVRFREPGGLRLPEVLARGDSGSSGDARGKQLGRLLEGLLEAHAAGLVHGELTADFILETDTGLKLFGLMTPDAREIEELRSNDLAGVASILASVAPHTGKAAELEEIVGELERHPRVSLVDQAARRLIR